MERPKCWLLVGFCWLIAGSHHTVCRRRIPTPPPGIKSSPQPVTRTPNTARITTPSGVTKEPSGRFTTRSTPNSPSLFQMWVAWTRVTFFCIVPNCSSHILLVFVLKPVFLSSAVVQVVAARLCSFSLCQHSNSSFWTTSCARSPFQSAFLNHKLRRWKELHHLCSFAVIGVLANFYIILICSSLKIYTLWLGILFQSFWKV